MSNTMHKQINVWHTNKRLEEKPEYAQILVSGLTRMKSGQYKLTPVLAQKFREWDLYDASAFLEMHTALWLGKILYAEIHLGIMPFSDKHVQKNNDALAQLPFPFYAKFQGGVGDNDGYFRWNEEVAVGIFSLDGIPIEKKLSPGTAPLEVGYCHASRCVLHLIEERFLARWPYNSEIIYLFHVADESLWQADI